jgi:HSP20 family protein
MATLNYQPSAVGPSLLDDFFSPLWQGSRMKDLLRAPEAEVVETQNDIRVVLDTPGITAEDIDISLENNILTVSGERKSSWSVSDAREATWHISERRYGKFSRSFMLPRDVEQDRIEAGFDNGVLSITIPKSEKARRRRIEIRAGSNGGSRIESGPRQ